MKRKELQVAKAKSAGDLIAAAAASVHKRFKSTSMGLAENVLERHSVFASLGALSLDRLCAGVNPGGVPIGPRRGSVVHIFGEWSTGKTLLLDAAFKGVQDLDGLGLCSESEGTKDPHFLNQMGVDQSKLVIQYPDTIEEMIDIGLEWHDAVRRAEGEGPYRPIVWGVDSIDAGEAEKAAAKGLSESGAWHYGGGKSEALGAGLRKVAKRCRDFPTTMILLNQTRANVGVMFGPDRRTGGGDAPHFYASLEISLSPGPLGIVRGDPIKLGLSKEQRKKLGLPANDQGNVIGRWVRGTIVKTKIAQTFLRKADFYIDFRKGVGRWQGFLPYLLQEGRAVLEPNGAVIFRTKSDGELSFKSPKEWALWAKDHFEEFSVWRFIR